MIDRGNLREINLARIFCRAFAMVLFAMTSHVQSTGQEVFCKYDMDDRLIEVNYPDSTNITYCYDELGNRECLEITKNNIAIPDLYVHFASVSSNSLCQNASFNLQFQLDNLGDVDAAGFYIKHYLSMDTILDVSTDVLLQIEFEEGMAATQTLSKLTPITLTNSVTPGSYYLIVSVDEADQILELSELNNTVYAALTVNNQSGFDFNVTSNASSCHLDNGSIGLYNLTGQSPYNFNWSHDPTLNSVEVNNLASGNYYLTIVDDDGCSEVAEIFVDNIGNSPAPSFTYSIVDDSVYFTSTTSNADSFYWDFGDGDTSAKLSPVHGFNHFNDYFVCLTGTNSCGVSSSCTEVNFVPTAIADYCSATIFTNFDLPFKKNYALNNGLTRFTKMVHLEDNTFLVVGQPKNSGQNGFGITKITENGQIISNVLYAENSDVNIKQISQHSDGLVYFCGSISENGMTNGLIGKMNSCGGVLWASSIGGSSFDRINDFIINTAGNIVAVGSTENFGNGLKEVWVLEYDVLGNILWSKTYGSTHNEVGSSICMAMGPSAIEYVIGGYIVDYSGNSNSSNRAMLVLSIDSLGSLISKYSYYDNTQEADRLEVKEVIEFNSASGSKLYALASLVDGDGYVGGQEAFGYDLAALPFYLGNITIIDLNGEIQKSRLIRHSFNQPLTMINLEDQAFLIPSENFLTKLDLDLNVVKEVSYETGSAGVYYDVVQDSSKFYICGYNENPLFYALDTILDSECHQNSDSLENYDVSNVLDKYVLGAYFTESNIPPNSIQVHPKSFNSTLVTTESVTYCPVDSCRLNVKIVQEDMRVCQNSQFTFVAQDPFGYQFNWYSNGSMSDEGPSFNFDSIGEFEIVVESTNNVCFAFDTIIVNVDSIIDPFEVEINIVNPSNYFHYDGSIELEILSNPSETSYQWSTGDTTSSIINLASGEYEGTVTYNKSCKEIYSANLIDKQVNSPDVMRKFVIDFDLKVSDIVQLSNGDYLITGCHGIFNHFFIARVNVMGEMMWAKKSAVVRGGYLHDDYEDVLNIQITADTSEEFVMIFINDRVSTFRGYDYLIKLSIDGEMLFSKKYVYRYSSNGTAFSQNVNINELITLNDGTFAAVGGGGIPHRQLAWMRFDEFANVLWYKEWGGEGHEELADVVELPNGSMYVVGDFKTNDYRRGLYGLVQPSGFLDYHYKIGNGAGFYNNYVHHVATNGSQVFISGTTETSNGTNNFIRGFGGGVNFTKFLQYRATSLAANDNTIAFSASWYDKYLASIDFVGDVKYAAKHTIPPYGYPVGVSHFDSKVLPTTDGGYLSLFNAFNFANSHFVKTDSFGMSKCFTTDATSQFQSFVTPGNLVTSTDNENRGINRIFSFSIDTPIVLTPISFNRHVSCPSCDLINTSITVEDYFCAGEDIFLIQDSLVEFSDKYWLINGEYASDQDTLRLNLKNGAYEVGLFQTIDMCYDTIYMDLQVGNPAINFQLENDITVCQQYQLINPIDSLAIIWSTGDTSNHVTVYQSGVYSATVTDYQDCQYIDSVEITIVPQLDINSDTRDNTCDNNGFITTSVEYGNEPYLLSWSTGQASNDIFGLEGGIFVLTVSDAGSCTEIDTFLIADLDTEIEVVVDDIACYGDDGSISVTLFNGFPDYDILWSNGDTIELIDNLSPGNFAVTISDTSGCSFTRDFELGTISPMGIVDTTICPGEQLTLYATDVFGHDPNNFLWSTGESGYSISVSPLSSTTYSVMYTDSLNSCQGSVQVIVNDGLDLVEQLSQPTCHGFDNGEILITDHSNNSLSYIWSDGALGNNRTNLLAGEYEVTISNSGGCSVITSYFLNEPEDLIVQVIVNHITQPDSANGNAFAFVSGGSGPYLYAWSSGQSTAEYISNLAIGSYTISVSDTNGCSEIVSFEIGFEGCSDSLAHNYMVGSTIDDGSCKTCTDFIQNGDETGIDCGGQVCDLCTILGLDCPHTLDLAPATIVNGRYKADQLVKSDNLIQGIQKVNYESGQMILLEPDFEIELGVEFEAKIKDCIPE